MTSIRLEPVLDALARSDRYEALTIARALGTEHPDSLVAAHLGRYLASDVTGSGVYVDPAAFQAFIGGGSNVSLYEATSAALRDRWPATPFRLLDIGAGDGHALVPAVSDRGTVQVTAVEPSAAMATRLGERLPSATVHATTAQEFLHGLTDDHWDVGESTFAMHAIATQARPPVLAELARRCDRYVMVDFDVPTFSGQRDPARVRYCTERYEISLAEYEDDDHGLVAQGFLLPVLLGGFDPSVPQSTWEQPADAWAHEFRAAGYTTVTTEHLCDYPWAPAFVLTAVR